MAKLNQIIAIEKGIKSTAQQEFTAIYHAVQKPDLFNGFVKKYQSNSEGGDELPEERKHVQRTYLHALDRAEELMGEIMDITARKDFTNCEAAADVKVGDKVIVAKAPVTYLLFLEKSLTDVRTMVAALPVLDPGEDWKYDTDSGLNKSAEVKTHRTKKVQKPLVLYPATERHPAQTQIVTEDVIEGYWTQVKHSGAISKTEKDKLIERLDDLLQAVKQAREEANGIDEVKPTVVGSAIFAFLRGRS